MGTLAHQQQLLHHQQFPQSSKVVPVFVGSISGGISDAFLNDLLSVSWVISCDIATQTDDYATRLVAQHNL